MPVDGWLAMERSRRRRLADTYITNVERVAAILPLEKRSGGGDDDWAAYKHFVTLSLSCPHKAAEHHRAAWRCLLSSLNDTFRLLGDGFQGP